MPIEQPTSTVRHSLPRWLNRNVPKGNANHFTAKLVGQLGLQTVCDHAKCPNRMECYAQKTAAFLILGDICTRGCRFCSVRKGKPRPVDADEPRRVAEAARQLGLKHVVVTGVARDDLPDGGAEHFHHTVKAVRAATDATVEVLPSDFGGNAAAVDRLVEAAPEVYNHNVETVPRLFHAVRDRRTDYGWTLEMFRRIRRAPAIHLKTGLMLGLGETTEELLDTLADLLEAGCRMLTLGQYLQPTPAQAPVARYVPPEEFDELGRLARQMGFTQVASGPFVRSSYHAREMVCGTPSTARPSTSSPAPDPAGRRPCRAESLLSDG
jgi:lipoic acid synthetase